MRRIKRRSVLFALSLAAMFSTSAAEAATVIVTYTGQVKDIQYSNTLFGGVAVGDPYTAVLKFDTSSGVPVNHSDAVQSIQNVYGGISGGGHPSPSHGTVITIGGNSYSFGGAFGSTLSDTHFTAGGNTFYADSQQLVGGIYTMIGFNIGGDLPGFPAPASIVTPFSLMPSYGTGAIIVSDRRNFLARDDFTVDFISVATAVPEPATWALLVIGFGGIGAALRHQRSRRASAA